MSTSPRTIAGGIAGTLIVILIVATIAGFSVYFFYCPCERTPGGYLLGNVIEEPVEDWSFANEVPLCQVQVDAGLLPHSINLNCMATDDGRLYLSCAGCEGKVWSSAALDEPLARLRVGDDVYPVRLTRVTDPEVLDQAWRARAEKAGRGLDVPRQEGWWSFRVQSRERAQAG